MSRIARFIFALVALGLIGSGLWMLSPAAAMIGLGMLLWIDLCWEGRRR